MSEPAQAVVDAFRPVNEELEAELEVVEGEVPREIRGVLYRNGVGRLEVYGTPQMHPFDGDGMVSRFRVAEGRVTYRNRYVRTREFEEEARSQRMLYRGFGTNLPGGFARNALRMRFKNAANTSVILHGGRLLALWEAGVPHALDPESLRTIGRFDYDGALRNHDWATRWINDELPFSAHPKVDPETGELWNFGLQIGPRTKLQIYRVNAHGVLSERRTITLDEPCFMHDFVITREYAVFFASPVKFDVARALSGISTPVEAIRRNPGRATEVLVVPRDGGEARRFQAPEGFFCFHFFDAFSRDGSIVVDGCRMDDFAGGTIDVRDVDAIREAVFDPAFLTRWTIDLEAGRVSERRLCATPMELPTIDRRFVGRPRRLGWATARTRNHGAPLLNGLARIDFESAEVSTRDLCPDLPGEPVFVPVGSEEGEGWLLTVVYRAEARISELWVVDPGTLRTQARVALPHHQPPGFHGCFAPD